MGRAAKLWRRKGRAGWWATVGGKQVCFGDDHAAATGAFRASKAQDGTPKPAARVPVATAADRYLDQVRSTVKPKTWRLYRVALGHWTKGFGRRAVASLEGEDLERWLNRPGWSDSTRHNYGAVVKIWARWCARKKYLAASPFGGVKLPPIAPRRAAEPGALAAVLAAASPEFRDFLAVCIETGCRPGEVRTLEARQVAWETATAIVDGKTGERLIGLSDRATGILRASAAKYPTGPILRNERGKPWTEPTLFARMDAIRVKLGPSVGRVVAYHCRHDFWSRAVKAGVSDVAVAKQLGHANLKMLHRTYAHADHQIMRDTAQRASGEQGE